MKSTNLLSRTCIAMVLTMLATTAIAQTQTIHTLKMTDGTVNQNYNTDALIDMQSTSKGLLLPRVELTGTTAAAPLANHTAGMVVYNTVSAGSGGTAVSPGYYYNDGTQWVKIGSAAAISAWGQYGNTGTTPAANWIGTNDVADFVTKTNGAERLRVTSGGKLLVGTAASLTGGANAIMQINNGTTNGALQIVDGTQAAGYVLTSDANGLATWTDGSGIAWTLKGNSGITANNAAYGSSLTAGTGNWLGSINSADLILAANNKEGLRVNTAQQVLIGTTTVPTGGTTAKVIIDNGTTNGALQIKDGTQGANKVLTSDANGVAKWALTTSTSWQYHGSKSASLPGGREGVVVVYAIVDQESISGAYDTNNGIFTVPIDGTYQIDCSLYTPNVGITEIYVFNRTKKIAFRVFESTVTSYGLRTCSSAIFQCNVGDQLSVVLSSDVAATLGANMDELGFTADQPSSWPPYTLKGMATLNINLKK